MFGRIKFMLIIIGYLLLGTSYANNNSPSNNKFNFNTLSKAYNLTATYDDYDPNLAQEYCSDARGVMPQDAIWLNDVNDPIPNPEPTTSDCGEYSTQQAYGCEVAPNNLGEKLQHFVVKVRIPVNNAGKSYQCSGVVVGQDWVLTAAHCVMNQGLDSILTQKPVLVVGAEDKSSMLPVSAIFVPTDVTKSDLALLHLKYPLPKYYTPIELAKDYNKDNISELWASGYGMIEDNKISAGNLLFRKNYFISDKYNKDWTGGAKGNDGEFYVTGSKPAKYKGVYSAWKFSGRGDSGGPILEYNKETKKILLLGINSKGLFCNYAGYFAKMPYPISVAVSMPYYYTFIHDVMNGNISSLKVNCISAFGDCEYFAYVANEISGTIFGYKINSINGLIDEDYSGTIALRPSMMKFTTDNKSAYILSEANNILTEYKLYAWDRPLLHYQSSFQTGNGPTDIAFDRTEKYAYVSNIFSDSISIFGINDYGNLMRKSELYDSHHLNRPISIEVVGDYAYILNSQNVSTNKGSISKYKINSAKPDDLEYVASYPTGISPTDIKADPSGKHIYVTNARDNTIWVYPINNMNEHIEIKADPGKYPYKITFAKVMYNGISHLYAYVINQNTDSVAIYKVNEVSGDLQYISSMPTGQMPSAITVDKNSRFVYVTNFDEHTIRIYTIRSGDGHLRVAKDVLTGYGPSSIVLR